VHTRKEHAGKID